jgi:hypothetical protein
MTLGFRAPLVTCSACGCGYALRADGLVRRHRIQGPSGWRPFCPGSLRAPKAKATA